MCMSNSVIIVDEDHDDNDVDEDSPDVSDLADVVLDHQGHVGGHGEGDLARQAGRLGEHVQVPGEGVGQGNSQDNRGTMKNKSESE